jgi:hypothetical protein
MFEFLFYGVPIAILVVSAIIAYKGWIEVKLSSVLIILFTAILTMTVIGMLRNLNPY